MNRGFCDGLFLEHCRARPTLRDELPIPRPFPGSRLTRVMAPFVTPHACVTVVVRKVSPERGIECEIERRMHCSGGRAGRLRERVLFT